jgi:hypothetical protein
MASHIEANHLIVKVGHGPHYFPETTRTMVQRVRSLGYHPLAWVQITDRAPKESLKAIVAALSQGYEAAVLHVGTAMVSQAGMQELARALDNVEIPRDRLYAATPPLPYLPDRRVLGALAPVCQGGWMPMAFAAWGDTVDHIIDRDIYQALGDISLLWDKTPDVYPVLSPLYRLQGETTLLPEEFIPWVESIARHGVDFFSVYHAANTEKVLWSLLESVNVPCLETSEHETAVATDLDDESSVIPQPVYITISASDTVWGIITRHGLTKDTFWRWNAHLWESRGLPRDPDYLQEGWRIRVK